MKKITYIIAFILTLSSCEKEVNIPIEYTEPKLVINALFNTDSLWSIEVSESQYIYDTITLPLIDNAEVSITDSDNNTITLTSQGEGIYTSTSEKPVIAIKEARPIVANNLGELNSYMAINIRYPRPALEPIHSPTIAPITLIVTEILSAEKI